MTGPYKTCIRCKKSKELVRTNWKQQYGVFVGACKECYNERQQCSETTKRQRRDHYKKNRARLLAKTKEWCRKNPDKKKIINARYALKYPDRVKEQHRLRLTRAKTRDWCDALLRSTKARAKQRDIEFALIKEDIAISYEAQAGKCCYTNIPLDLTIKSGNHMYPSIDRVEPARGYLPDNIKLCSWIANRAKGALKQDEFIAWLNLIIEYRKSS